jgi:hypothetical protein
MKAVCQNWFGAVVLVRNISVALTSIKACFS